MCVHPDYRRRGIGRRLYESRKEIVRAFGLKGVVAGGMLVGYHRHCGAMAAEEYLAKVVAGELVDPTVTFQLRCGFKVKGVIPNYIEDDSCKGFAALILWENDHQQPKQTQHR